MRPHPGQTIEHVVDGHAVTVSYIGPDNDSPDTFGIYRVLTDHPTHREYRAGRIVSIRDDGFTGDES